MLMLMLRDASAPADRPYVRTMYVEHFCCLELARIRIRIRIRIAWICGGIPGLASPWPLPLAPTPSPSPSPSPSPRRRPRPLPLSYRSRSGSFASSASCNAICLFVSSTSGTPWVVLPQAEGVVAGDARRNTHKLHDAIHTLPPARRAPHAATCRPVTRHFGAPLLVSD
jgi:hypothetical protein